MLKGCCHKNLHSHLILKVVERQFSSTEIDSSFVRLTAVSDRCREMLWSQPPCCESVYLLLSVRKFSVGRVHFMNEHAKDVIDESPPRIL